MIYCRRYFPAHLQKSDQFNQSKSKQAARSRKKTPEVANLMILSFYQVVSNTSNWLWSFQPTFTQSQ